MTPAALATLATSAAALLVLVLYAPALQAPFLVPKFAALEVLGSVGLVAFFWQRARSGTPRWDRTVTVGIWLVLGASAASWIAASCGSTRAPYALDAAARCVSCLGLACAASVIANDHAARQRILEAVTMSAAAVAAIGLLQHLEWLPIGIPIISTPGSTFGNRNLAAEAMSMALPLGLGAGARQGATRNVNVAIWASLAIEVVYLGVTRARGAWIGAACGLGIALVVGRPSLPRATPALGLAAFLVAGVAAALPARHNARDLGDVKRYSGVAEVIEESLDARSTALRTRLGLWRRTAAMTADHPLLGVGPGNWPIVFPRYAEPGATRDGVLAATRMPRQAHDDIHERAAETGVPGLIAALVLAGGIASAARRQLRDADDDSRPAVSGAVGALAALAVLCVGSFPLEMPGTLMLTGIALGLLVVDRQDRSRERTPMLAHAGVACALVLVLFAVARSERKVRSSGWLGAAERTLRADQGPTATTAALADLKRALDANGDDCRANLRNAQMLLREHHALDSILAARKALDVEPNAPNAWATLAAADLASGDDSATTRDSTRALTLLADFPFALYLRALANERSGTVVDAEADRARLRSLADGPDADNARDARSLLDVERVR